MSVGKISYTLVLEGLFLVGNKGKMEYPGFKWILNVQ